MGRLVTLVAAVVAALASLLAVPPARATPVQPRIDAWARSASTIVVARALSVDGLRIRFWILDTLKGKPGTREFDATLKEPSGCVPSPPGAPRPVVPVGTRFILFLGPQSGDSFPIVDSGFAHIDLRFAKVEETVEAVRRVAEIESLAIPGDRIKAYLDAVENDNAALRQVARIVLTTEISDRAKAAPFEERLVALLRSKVLDARVTGLQALRYSRSEKALPALLESVGDENRTIRECASMALAPYDTEVTVPRLIEAARLPDMLDRVCIDLKDSRRPEAKEFLRRARLGEFGPLHVR